MNTDLYNDTSLTALVGYLRDHPKVAEKIRGVSVDQEKQASMPDSAFADPFTRRFPIWDEGNAFVSSLYASRQPVRGDVQLRLKTAAEVYGFDLPEPELPAVPDGEPLTRVNLKYAAEHFGATAQKRSPEENIQFCQELIRGAEALGQEIPKELWKNAGLTACNTRTLRDWVNARSAAIKDPKGQEVLTKLASDLNRMPVEVHDPEGCRSFVDGLHQIDQAYGLDSMYGRDLPDPVVSVFNTSKRAEETIDILGTAVPMSVLVGLPSEVYWDIFGHDVAEEVINDGIPDPDSLRVILPSLPRDLLSVFLRHVKPYLASE